MSGGAATVWAPDRPLPPAVGLHVVHRGDSRMSPVVVDFSIRPAELANAVVRHQRAVITSSYVAVPAGGYLKVDFTADAEEAAAEATLRVTVLGAAVMDLELNSAVVA